MIANLWSSDSYDIEELIANINGIGYSVLWQCTVGGDTLNSDNYIIQVSSLLIRLLARIKGKYDSPVTTRSYVSFRTCLCSLQFEHRVTKKNYAITLLEKFVLFYL